MAVLEDAKEIYAIYEPYILNTVVSFEYDKVPLEIFEERIRKVKSGYPWLVYTVDGEIAGYAYCSLHRERAAYAWDCECSVYIKDTYHKQGIGTVLYNALFELAEAQGVYNIYSLICVPNEGSVALHKKFGFTEVGTYYKTAYKFGEWRDLLVMEKRLRTPQGAPDRLIPVSELDNRLVEEILKKYIKHEQ
ncbi:phosphinothricin acetyltransferase [Anaerocolumna xylanovorans DSM 12503]|uniref:Phosphinothricin acetyltransferase n=2 Tax=Anaerocolumna TaxID=1843210 RepID=A0A1M7Y2A8_9FIRM|nr:phosphinothricin acetyltransferase [Anaerocolumna xylanovorans DSM 12503]